MAEWSLVCGRCGRRPADVRLATVCPSCGRPLLVRYGQGRADSRSPPAGSRSGSAASPSTVDPPEAAVRRPGGSGAGMWRYRDRLPLRDGEGPVTLGEGGTPLLPLRRLGTELGLRLLAKDESGNPTGSFKDRGLSAAVTRAALDGAESLVIPSAGNAGASLAAYAARAGLPARIFIPHDTPAGVERRCRHFGAEVVKVEGLIDACGRRAREYAAETGAMDVSTLREPYRLEGKKTMMWEIAEALGGRAPDAIVYPTGGGTGLVASWKALREIEGRDGLAPATRLYAAQAEGCAPIVRAWEAGEATATPEPAPATRAWGLRVPAALGDFLILEALRESGGAALAIGDDEMEEAAGELGRREGLNASIEGGATLAAARRLRAAGRLHAGETVVLFNTAGVLVY